MSTPGAEGDARGARVARERTRVALEKARVALERAWRRSDALFALVAPSALGERPILERQPIVFYLGHLPAFAWNQCRRGAFDLASFAPAFDDLFERGIDPPPGTPPADTAWPPVDEIVAYRDRVRRELRAAIDDLAARAARAASSGDGNDAARSGAETLALVVEHELMHHETLLYMLARLPSRRKVRPADVAASRAGAGLIAQKIAIPAGVARLGTARGTATAGEDAARDLAARDLTAWDFAWDNEVPEHLVDVPAFTIDSVPVRNADFLRFVEDGGYENDALWTESDATWRTRAGLAHPLDWTWRDGAWAVRTMFEDVPFEDAAGWPVSVSLAEARAFARWRGARLPTEAELHRAAYATPDGTTRPYPWGSDPPSPARGTFDFADWSPTPVGSHPAGASAWGVHEIVGNGWEWTDTPFAPYPGFAPFHDSYPGYSADFFDGRHFVLLGASWATSRGLMRRSFRNWFRAEYPFVFSKFRLVW